MSRSIYLAVLGVLVVVAVIATPVEAQVYPMSWDSSRQPAPAPLTETGQTTAYATGDDGDLQRGVAWPIPRFTDNGDGTVTDNLTSLIWLKDANCFGLRTWQGALDQTVLLNTTPIVCTDYAGLTFTDWRLPNVKELLSLVDYSQSDPALPSSHPFVSVMNSAYWSSSTSVTAPDRAWAMFGGDGLAARGFFKSGILWVWPVRGGQ